MLELIYATDLHGQEDKYNTILTYAKANNIKLILLGADLLPKSYTYLDLQEKFFISTLAGKTINPKAYSTFERQKKFITTFLKKFYSDCNELGIDVLAFWGNDDYYPLKKQFKKFSTLLDEVPFSKENYVFKAYQYVQDYPFPLKTGCKLDSTGWVCPESYIGNGPVDIADNGDIKPIKDIKEYFLKKGTIQEDLENIKVDANTIMLIHQPPVNLCLDVCPGGREVGSQAVYSWVKKEQPLLLLCGHVHESPQVSGIWKAKVGKTLVIQPGQQVSHTTFVHVKISKNIQAKIKLI